MPRSKRTIGRRTRVKKLFKSVKGSFGTRRNTLRMATQTALKAGQYQYRDRRNRKREFRRLWITRIGAASTGGQAMYPFAVVFA